jgi:hypothetical protein
LPSINDRIPNIRQKQQTLLRSSQPPSPYTSQPQSSSPAPKAPAGKTQPQGASTRQPQTIGIVGAVDKATKLLQLPRYTHTHLPEHIYTGRNAGSCQCPTQSTGGGGQCRAACDATTHACGWSWHARQGNR